jgi:hypothetical protein
MEVKKLGVIKMLAESIVPMHHTIEPLKHLASWLLLVPGTPQLWRLI